MYNIGKSATNTSNPKFGYSVGGCYANDNVFVFFA